MCDHLKEEPDFEDREGDDQVVGVSSLETSPIDGGDKTINNSYLLVLYPYTAERRDVFSNASRLEAVYGHSFRISREVLILWCDNRWL